MSEIQDLRNRVQKLETEILQLKKERDPKLEEKSPQLTDGLASEPKPGDWVFLASFNEDLLNNSPYAVRL